MHVEQNAARNVVGVNLVLKLSDKEKILSLLPLFHAYLQIVNLWIATTCGCEVEASGFESFFAEREI